MNISRTHKHIITIKKLITLDYYISSETVHLSGLDQLSLKLYLKIDRDEKEEKNAKNLRIFNMGYEAVRIYCLMISVV